MSRNASGWDSWCCRIACLVEKEKERERRKKGKKDARTGWNRSAIVSRADFFAVNDDHRVTRLLDFVETRNTSSRDRSNSLSHLQSRVSRNSFLPFLFLSILRFFAKTNGLRVVTLTIRKYLTFFPSFKFQISPSDHLFDPINWYKEDKKDWTLIDINIVKKKN